MNDSPGSVELLSNRIDELEKRVHALEHPQEAMHAAVPAPVQSARPAALGADSVLETSNLFPTLGRAMLGIAGAYLLRAIAAASVAPKAIVAALAVLYAFAWLVWASRVSRSSSLSSTVYATTSTLILAPMLWETTLRFQTLSPMATACVLSACVILASVFESRSQAQQVLWVVYTATAITAAALSLATHRLLPFLYVLLLIAVVCEIPRMLARSRPMWWIAALAGDIAVWGMIFIYAGPPDSRTEYPSLPLTTLILPSLCLFAIYATSVSIRAIFREYTITIFETLQAMTAFLLAVCAVFYLAPQAGTVPVGIACLIFAAAGYAASFRYLRRLAAPRNFQVFGIWSASLLAAGTIWVLPHAAPILIAIAAMCAYTIGRHTDSAELELHGALFVILATAISIVPRFVFSVLVGADPSTPALQPFVLVGFVTAAYALSTDRPNHTWTRQLLSFLPALAATAGLAALLVSGFLAAVKLAIVVDVHHIAFIRTLVLSSISLSLAFAGSRWRRPAMTRLAYVTLVCVTAKLLFEDLRHGHMGFIAASIFLFAITLIDVPRLIRSGNRLREASAHKTVASETEIGGGQPTHVA